VCVDSVDVAVCASDKQFTVGWDVRNLKAAHLAMDSLGI
jgi:hypothetical protein